MKADERSFKHDTNAAEALLYYKNMSLIQLLGTDKMRKPTMVTLILSVEVTKELHRSVILKIDRPILLSTSCTTMATQIMSAEPTKD